MTKPMTTTAAEIMIQAMPSRSERQKERLKDPLYKAVNYAYGVYGLLHNRIKDSIDPSRTKRRSAKLWETRRANGKVSESCAKAHQTRKERYGKSGVKDPEAVRKTLSLAHMGKGRKP
jgi:hypothetical protein